MSWTFNASQKLLSQPSFRLAAPAAAALAFWEIWNPHDRRKIVVGNSSTNSHRCVALCEATKTTTPTATTWDYNWDGRGTSSSYPYKDLHDYRSSQQGVTRHVILVRHGQYDESSKLDSKRRLTELGRKQAERTGRRLAELIQGGSKSYPSTTSKRNSDDMSQESGRAQPCPMARIYVSNMTRAKETAEIILEQLHTQQPALALEAPDPDLNEAWPPAPIVPARPDLDSYLQSSSGQHYAQTDQNAMERAFQRYVHRGGGGTDHEFIIVVCHGNVIRYLFLRALQLPPSAWLRLCTMNCSLTYLVVKPNGYVSARLLGDVGHIPYDEVTFSGSHGFAW